MFFNFEFPADFSAGYRVDGYGSCKGDSGGPIVVHLTDSPHERYVLIGLVVGGFGKCGDGSTPGIYVRIEDPEIYRFIQGFLGEGQKQQGGGATAGGGKATG